MQIAATLAVARPAGRQLAYNFYFYFPPSHFGLRSAEANDRPVRGWRHDGAAAHISHFGDFGVFAGRKSSQRVSRATCSLGGGHVIVSRCRCNEYRTR